MNPTPTHFGAGIPTSFPEGEALLWLGGLAILHVTGEVTWGRTCW